MHSNRIVLALAAALACALVGCQMQPWPPAASTPQAGGQANRPLFQWPPPTPAPAAPATAPTQRADSALGACPERLQDLIGPLLEYYALHGRLPARLTDLEPLDAAHPLQLSCPVSGQSYIYNPDGPAEEGGRLIVYDALPVHNGLRWAVLFQPPQPGKPIVARVVGRPDSVFTKRLTTRPASQPAGN